MKQTIAVVGGTGNLGAALARRWAKAGRDVIIGSRTADKAREAADRLGGELGTHIRAAANLEAAQAADIVVITVPFASQHGVIEDIRSALAGKIVIDTTVPLMPPKVARVQLPTEGSAAQRAQNLLGDDVRLVSAFHNVAAHKLATDQVVDCDVLVFGDDQQAPARRDMAVIVKKADERHQRPGTADRPRPGSTSTRPAPRAAVARPESTARWPPRHRAASA